MLQTLKSQTESILQEYPETRDSDITLLIGIWTTFYGVGATIRVEQLFELPRQDNVKRMRAKFQNEEGKYLPTKLEIALKRGILESKWREFMGYAQPNPNFYKEPMEKETTASFPLEKQADVIAMCPRCGSGMIRQIYHNEMREKPIEIIKCVKCGKEL